MKQKNIVIIPARGGSKRIPQKNIKPFLGKPIIAYSIETAKQSELFNEIIVSTDSDEIAEVATQYGAEVPFKRPAELADDFTGTDAVFLHALEWLNENDKAYDYACCLYPTAPAIKAQHLQKGWELLQEKQGTSTISVVAYSSRIFRAFKMNERNRLEMIWPEYRMSRSNDLPESYYDVGQFYWADVNKYLKERDLYSYDAIPVILPHNLVQDIDTLEDWEVAEKLYNLQ